jgi:hypothetical protein
MALFIDVRHATDKYLPDGLLVGRLLNDAVSTVEIYFGYICAWQSAKMARITKVSAQFSATFFRIE